VPVDGHGDDPGVMVMTLLSHSMTFTILSPRKFADVAGNLMRSLLSLSALKAALIFLERRKWCMTLS
jgi:hypothetical protein